MTTRADLDRATATLDPPFAVVDMVTLRKNQADLVRRAGGLPIRLASKSVRVRALLDSVLTDESFSGVLAYSVAEACWLADHGIDDVVVAYPSVDRQAITAVAADDRRRAAVTLMIDSPARLDLVDATLGRDHPPASLYDGGPGGDGPRRHRAGLRLKPIGAGHSFTGIGITDGVHVDLSRMAGLPAPPQRRAGRPRPRHGQPGRHPPPVGGGRRRDRHPRHRCAAHRLSAMVTAVELVTALVLDAAVAAPNEPRLASLVADLAELLKASEHVTARGVTLDQLAERAASLQEEGDAEAEEVATLIEHARGIRQADR